MYLAADPQNADEHLAVVDEIDKKHPSVAAEYDALRFDPAKTPKIVQDMALSAKDRDVSANRTRSGDTAELRAAVAGGRTGLVIRASDPTLGDEDHAAAVKALKLWEESNKRERSAAADDVQARFEQRERDREAKDARDDARLHSTVQQQEQAQWQLRQRYGNAIAAAKAGGQTTVKDPKTQKDIPIEDAQSIMEEAKSKATLLQNQAAGIRSRRQWGEFAPSGAPAAQPATPAAGAAPAQPTAGPGRGAPAPTQPTRQAAPPAPPKAVVDNLKPGIHTFANGQTWQKNPDGTLVFVSGQ